MLSRQFLSSTSRHDQWQRNKHRVAHCYNLYGKIYGDASLPKQPFPRVCPSPELNNYSHHLIIMKIGPRCFNQRVAARTFPLLMAILRSSGMGGGVRATLADPTKIRPAKRVCGLTKVAFAGQKLARPSRTRI